MAVVVVVVDVVGPIGTAATSAYNSKWRNQQLKMVTDSSSSSSFFSLQPTLLSPEPFIMCLGGEAEGERRRREIERERDERRDEMPAEMENEFPPSQDLLLWSNAAANCAYCAFHT